MPFISKEVPSGSIDGVNKTFTTAYTVYQLDDVFVDGAIYTGATASGTTLTLSDAPQHTLEIDYWYGSAPVPGALITLNDVWDALLRLKKDLSDVPQATFIEWCNYVNNFAYRFLIGIDPQRFIQEQTYNYVPGTTAYTIPLTFRDMAEYGCGLFEVDSNTGLATDTMVPHTRFGDPFYGFYISGGKINFTGNMQQPKSFVLRFIPLLATFTQMTDTFVGVIPSEYLLHIRDALDVMYARWDEDLPYEGFADQRFVRSLEELGRTFKQQGSYEILTDFSCYY